MSELADERSGELVARWHEGDQRAAAELFQRYANRLIALARSRLPNQLAHRVDPEDIMQSVCRIFFAGSRKGRYDLQRGGDLWQLLVTITLNKVSEMVKWHARQKRAVGREQSFGTEDSLFALQVPLLAQEPSGVEAMTLAEELEQVLRPLGLLERRMVELRLQGHNLEEIAAQTKRSERTVRRLLGEVKHRLEQRRGPKQDPGKVGGIPS